MHKLNGTVFAFATGLIGVTGAVPTSAHDISLYPKLQGGEWRRTENLKDTEGRFQARQEHTALEANGFVYVINGFVPLQPPPKPTETYASTRPTPSTCTAPSATPTRTGPG